MDPHFLFLFISAYILRSFKFNSIQYSARHSLDANVRAPEPWIGVGGGKEGPWFVHCVRAWLSGRSEANKQGARGGQRILDWILGILGCGVWM